MPVNRAQSSCRGSAKGAARHTDAFNGIHFSERCRSTQITAQCWQGLVVHRLMARVSREAACCSSQSRRTGMCSGHSSAASVQAASAAALLVCALSRPSLTCNRRARPCTSCTHPRDVFKISVQSSTGSESAQASGVHPAPVMLRHEAQQVSTQQVFAGRSCEKAYRSQHVCSPASYCLS